MTESLVPAARLAESRVDRVAPAARANTSSSGMPGRLPPKRLASAAAIRLRAQWRGDPRRRAAAALTFEFEEQIVGWPYFTIDAPGRHDRRAAGAGSPRGRRARRCSTPTSQLDAFHLPRRASTASRRFDFESLRWLQLHVRGARGPVRIRDVGVRRRIYPWPQRAADSLPASRSCSGSSTPRLNTLNNSAQETLVDGMGRERQQYSGDGGHQLHAVHLAFGETRLPARFLTTFSQGQTHDGYLPRLLAGLRPAGAPRRAPDRI